MTLATGFASNGDVGNRAFMSDIGHFRSTTAWTIAFYFRPNPGTPIENHCLMSIRRASNDARNHSLWLDHANGRIAYSYGLHDFQAASADASIVLGTWYGAALTSDGSNTVTLYLFSETGTPISAQTGLADGGYSDDSATQQVTLMAEYQTGITGSNYAGRMALPLFIRGTALSAGQLLSYFADPLNQGDSLMTSLSSQIAAWIDDSHTDQGPLGATVSFEGSANWSVNGVTVPDRAAGPDMTATTGLLRITGVANLTEPLPPSISAAGTFGVVYSGEQRVSVTGSNFGTTAPLVHLSNDSTGVSNMEEQIVRAVGETSFTFDCLITGLAPGSLYLWVKNQTVGHPAYLGRDSLQVTVRADPGPSVVALRRAAPALSGPINVAIATYSTAPEFYARHAQETLTYSVAAGVLPPGLSLNTTTGVVSGTISTSAGPGPYSATLRATDPNGSYAEQTLTWSVGSGAGADIRRVFFLRGTRGSTKIPGG